MKAFYASKRHHADSNAMLRLFFYNATRRVGGVNIVRGDMSRLCLLAQTPGCAYYMLAPDARTPFHTVGAVLFLEPAAGAATQARVHHAPDAHVVADFHLRNVLAHGVALQVAFERQTLKPVFSLNSL
jgi:hypothetical protein